MLERNCNNYLSYIAISIIISLIFTLLFYNGILSGIFYFVLFAFILVFVSFTILSILGSSDNGLTRKILCENIIFIIITIIGNIFSNILVLLVPLYPNDILSAIFVGFSFFFTILNIISLSILLISILKY